MLRAIHHFSKDDALNIGQFSASSLHEHAIDLVRLGGDVFDKQNGAGGTIS